MQEIPQEYGDSTSVYCGIALKLTYVIVSPHAEVGEGYILRR